MSKSKRKFYKTVVQVEILSEGIPCETEDLQIIHEVITDGDCSGVVEIMGHKELTPKEAALALMAQGSDPGFFNLTEEGEDADA